MIERGDGRGWRTVGTFVHQNGGKRRSFHSPSDFLDNSAAPIGELHYTCPLIRAVPGPYIEYNDVT
jgi:hypothetical protein